MLSHNSQIPSRKTRILVLGPKPVCDRSFSGWAIPDNVRKTAFPDSAEDTVSISGDLVAPSKPNDGTLPRHQITEESPSQDSSSAETRSAIDAPFVTPSLGIPCISGSLDHLLNCGHKILTDRPETCASNCQSYTTPTHDVDPFICVACIISEVKSNHDIKVKQFQREMAAIASASKKEVSKDELCRRLRVIDIGWQALDLQAIESRTKYGRRSHPFYIDSEYEEAVQEIEREHRRRQT